MWCYCLKIIEKVIFDISFEKEDCLKRNSKVQAKGIYAKEMHGNSSYKSSKKRDSF